MTKRSIFATLAALCVSVAFFSCNHALSEQSALPFFQQGASISIALPQEVGDALARYAAPRAAMSRQAASDDEGIIRIELTGGITRTEDFAWNGAEDSLTCTIGNLTVGATVTVDVSALVGGEKLYETKNPPRVTLTEGPNVANVLLTWMGIPLNVTFVQINGATVNASIGDAGGPFYNATAENPVTVAAFRIAETELTYGKWKEVYDWATSHGYKFANAGQKGGNYLGAYAADKHTDNEPVTRVSWRDAVVWCNAASEREGLKPAYLINEQPVRDSTNGDADSVGDGVHTNGYRLPTEAEWEFAARGGNPNDTTNWNYTYAGSDTADSVAWYKDNSGDTTHEVAKKSKNGAGLYDMCGNVWEHCWDIYPPSSRVHRGDGWYSEASTCTVAYRSKYLPDDSYVNLGFRVVRSVVQQ